MSSSVAETIPHSMKEDAVPPRPKLLLYPLRRGHLLQKREGRRREEGSTGQQGPREDTILLLPLHQHLIITHSHYYQ